MIITFILSLPMFLMMGFPLTNDENTAATFQQELTNLRKQLVPDPRLDVLTAQLTRTGQGWEVVGETTLPAAQDAVSKLAASLLKNEAFTTSIRLLPDPSLEVAKTSGLIRVSVAPMRREPRHAAEMVDQVTMGTPVSVLKQERNWSFIRTPYRYLGWVESSMVTPKRSDGWTDSSSVLFVDSVGTVWNAPDRQQAVCDIVLGCIVRKVEPKGEWTAVELPDGRRGVVNTAALKSFSGEPRQVQPSQVTALASRLKGIPYLWGGNSTKGFDCSGFTQTVFRMAGLQLPRDADQQSAVGKKVDPGTDFENVRAGDLLFFGKERATHVAISLGGARFIHSSTDVHVSSLKKSDPDFDEGRFRSLLQIMRVIE